MNILSLGAAVFIGSHLTKRLLNEGHAVTPVDLEIDKVSEFIDHLSLTFLQDDIRRPGWDLDRLVQDTDLVIDLIAYANPGLYLRIPLEVFQLNLIENLKIAEACVRHRKRLIQFSTCEVYGRSAATLKNARLIDPEDPLLAKFSEDTSEYILGPVSKHRWIYSCAKNSRAVRAIRLRRSRYRTRFANVGRRRPARRHAAVQVCRQQGPHGGRELGLRHENGGVSQRINAICVPRDVNHSVGKAF